MHLVVFPVSVVVATILVVKPPLAVSHAILLVSLVSTAYFVLLRHVFQLFLDRHLRLRHLLNSRIVPVARLLLAGGRIVCLFRRLFLDFWLWYFVKRCLDHVGTLKEMGEVLDWIEVGRRNLGGLELWLRPKDYFT